MPIGTWTAPAVALTVPCAETAAQNTGKFIACSSATSRTPPVVTSPRTPRRCSAVASSSPTEPSVLAEVVVTTASCTVATPNDASSSTAARSARGQPVTTTFLIAAPRLPRDRRACTPRPLCGVRRRGLLPRSAAAVAASPGEGGVVLPHVLLAHQGFHGAALDGAHLGDVQEDLRLKVALLWLVRLEKEDGRSAERLARSVVPGCLRRRP